MNESTPWDRSIRNYQARIVELEKEQRRLLARATWISRLRTVTFFAALVPLLLIETSPPERRWSLAGAGGLLLLVFLVLVRRHRRLRTELEEMESRIQFSRDGIARIRRDWEALQEPADPAAPAGHPYAGDLDVVGRASLLHLLNPAITLPGRRALRSWILQRADPHEVSPRQVSVQELAGRFSLREDLWVRGRGIRRESEGGLDRFLQWAEEGGSTPLLHPGRLWAARLLPVATFVLLALHLSGVVPLPLWLLPIGGVLVLERGAREGIHTTFDAAEGAESSVRTYHAILERIHREAGFHSHRLREIQDRMDAGGEPAHQALRGLRRWLDLAAVRYSGLSHAPLRLLLAWDFHVVNRLDRWRRRYGPHVRGWVEGMGELEALSALSALAHDHPDWVFPQVTEPESQEDRRLVGAEVGHPLLPPDRCVRNDVEVGPPGTFLLVTGSNMSGKSTLLRAMGLNAVLARAGGPVCARSFRIPWVRIRTSMRIRDSLEEGLSLFMAELRRLRDVVEAARREEDHGEPPVFYLLDEILQGTNTVERRIAARTVLRHLLTTGAIGAVTTHDLTLASAEDLQERAQAVHFRETIVEKEGGSTLHFDYTLRPGLATTTNALQLMRLVGLDEVREGDGS